MVKIEFMRAVREAKLRSPLQKFELVAQRIEFRNDPLTGRRCRINLNRTGRVRQVGAVSHQISELIERSRKKCYFCPENMEKSTPMFPWDPPRIKVGSACAFPNLFPFGEYHAVVTFSGDHYLPLDKFSPKLIKDSLSASLEYFRHVQKQRQEINYPTINWNYMPPSAASIFHPHLQTLADYKPTIYVQELLKKSMDYYRGNDSNYWADLIEEERKLGDRFIMDTGNVAWLASFSPQGNNEITAIFSRKISNLLQLKARDLSDFSTGLSKVLRGYQTIGVNSFNMAFFSGPNNKDLSKLYLLNAKLISRPRFTEVYVSDTGFMERFHDEPIIESRPEDVARRLKETTV